MTKKLSCTIYSAGLMQGITLVAFPAVSTILTSPDQYNFSNSVYGSLFISQACLSIIAAAMNPFLTRKFKAKRVLLFGLIVNLLSMCLLAFSAFFMHHFSIAYGVLIVATGALGLGFGCTVPTLNALSAQLHPNHVNTVLLILNALLGIGTALAPVINILFVSLGFWWGLPLSLTCALMLLIAFTFTLTFPQERKTSVEQVHGLISTRFGIFAIYALLYGIIETLNGNWVAIYLSNELHETIPMQSLALTSFWGMVTFGRIFFASINRLFSEKKAFEIAPFITTLAFLVIASLPSGAGYFAIAAFGLTGFGCSVLLPLIISFGTTQLKSIAASVPGMIITCYLLGYGIAAFGVGPLEQRAALDLREIYLLGALISFFLGLISLVIVRKLPSQQYS